MRSHKNISRKSFEPLGTNYSGKEVVTNYFRYISFGFWLADSHSVAWLLHNPVMSFLLPMFRIAGDEPPVASFPFTCPLHTCNRIGLVYMSRHSRACNTDVWRYTVQWNCAAKSNNTGGLARSIFFCLSMIIIIFFCLTSTKLNNNGTWVMIVINTGWITS